MMISCRINKCVRELKFLKRKWALSSAGRASALQAGGHRFEPYSAHHFTLDYIIPDQASQCRRGKDERMAK